MTNGLIVDDRDQGESVDHVAVVAKSLGEVGFRRLDAAARKCSRVEVDDRGSVARALLPDEQERHSSRRPIG